MWTLARSSDTSKRPNCFPVGKCLFTIIACALILFGGSCVVTDKIKFQDAVNHQLSMARYEPSSSIITVRAGAPVTFSATIWDEDVTDPSDGSVFKGVLKIKSEMWSGGAYSQECPSPGDATIDSDGADEPPVFVIACTVNLGMVPEAEEGDRLEVTLTVTDVGQASPDTTIAEVLWVAEILADTQPGTDNP